MRVAPSQDAEMEALVQEHYADVLRYCRRHAPAGLAEDAAQEAFLRFVRAGAARGRLGSPRAYLIAIARNVCIDMSRLRGGDWQELPEEIADGRGRTEDVAEAIDLAAALASLPRTQREAVELRYGQGLGVLEVARVLGVSRFAAARTLKSALDALRAQMEPEGESRSEDTRRRERDDGRS